MVTGAYFGTRRAREWCCLGTGSGDEVSELTTFEWLKIWALTTGDFCNSVMSVIMLIVILLMSFDVLYLWSLDLKILLYILS
jgi:hypothetical protein